METAVKEFNVLKTIALINRESILKNVFNATLKTNTYNYSTLVSDVIGKTLSEDKLKTLKDIYENIIVKTYSQQYGEISLEEKTPRRYGKNKIISDIIAQNGFTTELQKTMLALNDLKLMYINLNGKGVSDQFRGTTKLSDEDNRAIRAAILTFEKKVGYITKRKK